MSSDLDIVESFPRRTRIDKFITEERLIRDVVEEVENLGAYPLLTDVVILLGEAQEKLADWVDLQIENDIPTVIGFDCDFTKSIIQSSHRYCYRCGVRRDLHK